MLTIVGAGYTGLIAATQFPDATVIESGSEQQGAKHRALLRFRSPSIGHATGVEFRKVRVTKNVWDGECLKTFATIKDNNHYSQKVIGKLAARSIGSLEPVERYIAPPDFYERLVERVGSRILWDTHWAGEASERDPAVSTIPMPTLASLLGSNTLAGLPFGYTSIDVHRFRIEDADVFQTVYDADETSPIYRMSITGDLAIVEAVRGAEEDAWNLYRIQSYLCNRFGINHRAVEHIGSAPQRYGKIAPIDNLLRGRFILEATVQRKIYSLGRFATWRNILLDDLIHDIEVIKQLIARGDYAAHLRGY